jgi:hypothetical protein
MATKRQLKRQREGQLNCGGRQARVAMAQLREHPQPKAPKQCSLNQVIRLADLLNDSDLEELHSAIAALREARQPKPEPEPSEQPPDVPHDKRVSGGWIETKDINGSKYRYLRWRDGKRQRSKYLGKAK